MLRALFASSIAFSCCIAGQAAAQVNMHVGTFTIGAPAHCGGQRWCSVTVGPDAMRREGLQVTGSGGLPFGTNTDIVVSVICTPVGNRSAVAVVAASPNSATAERFRNAVRSRMVAARCL